jgi:hypothetical protein
MQIGNKQKTRLKKQGNNFVQGYDKECHIFLKDEPKSDFLLEL